LSYSKKSREKGRESTNRRVRKFDRTKKTVTSDESGPNRGEKAGRFEGATKKEKPYTRRGTQRIQEDPSLVYFQIWKLGGEGISRIRKRPDLRIGSKHHIDRFNRVIRGECR